MSLIVGILAVILVIYLMSLFLAPIIIGLITYGVYKGVLYYKKEKYFKSEEFKNHKKDVEYLADEFNKISIYADEISSNSKFTPKEKKDNSSLVISKNTSNHGYVRDREKREYGENTHVHSCSLAVVRNAEKKPMQYLTKYFDIEVREESLVQLQQMEENISNSKNAILNLEKRMESIQDNFNAPRFILKHYKDELMEQIGINKPNIEIDYDKYVFEYVSAGGNSSQRAEILFDLDTISAMAEYISERIKYKNSAKGQRALMTEKFRTQIKERDNYTCQSCSVSVEEQSLLLLEVDHIVPISKGGKSVEENLQTLCWRCNRTKGAKME